MDSIEILKRHNEWRRGGEGDMQNPTDIGLAIDDVIRMAVEGNVAIEVLRTIASGKRKTKEQRLAKSCMNFLETMRGD